VFRRPHAACSCRACAAGGAARLGWTRRARGSGGETTEHGDELPRRADVASRGGGERLAADDQLLRGLQGFFPGPLHHRRAARDTNSRAQHRDDAQQVLASFRQHYRADSLHPTGRISRTKTAVDPRQCGDWRLWRSQAGNETAAAMAQATAMSMVDSPAASPPPGKSAAPAAQAARCRCGCDCGGCGGCCCSDCGVCR
jgi:hypothetical protein